MKPARRSVPLPARVRNARRRVPARYIVPPLRGKRDLLRIYHKLLAHYGVQNWWSAESAWEIMVGAILTQNTSWKNVEKALENLRHANALEPAALHALDPEHLAALVRSAGFVTSKPRRLKNLAQFLLTQYGGEPANLRGGDLYAQRAQLLALDGIGPETGDAILLYVAEQPIFVIDAYTRRIFGRIGRWHIGQEPVTENVPYQDLQALFLRHLPQDVALYQEYHALLDVHAKTTCTKRAPRCSDCPLDKICLKVGVV